MANEKRLINANAMRQAWLENGENEYVYDTNAVLESIDAQPTVDAVEVVHAQWITKDGNIHCSHCDFTRATAPGYEMMVYNGEKWVSLEKTNYCPNCGAKMDGERKDDE